MFTPSQKVASGPHAGQIFNTRAEACISIGDWELVTQAHHAPPNPIQRCERKTQYPCFPSIVTIPGL